MQLCQISKHRFSKSSPSVVGTGLVALDVLLNGSGVKAETALGGSAGNVLAILGHLGWTSIPVAQLGVDSAADAITREFEGLGADIRFLWRSPESSTPVIYQLPGTQGRTHDFSFRCPFCGEKRGYVPLKHESISSTVVSGINPPDVFFFDRVTEPALELAEQFRNSGSLVMFEPSSIGSDKHSFARAIRAAHVLKYADERIEALQGFDCSSVDIEIQTRGGDGLVFRTSSCLKTWHSLGAFNVPYIADTAGAGDWCTSGFLYALVGGLWEAQGKGLISTRRIRESLRFGQILAALNCTQTGARGLAKAHARNEIVHLATKVRNSAANCRAIDNEVIHNSRPGKHINCDGPGSPPPSRFTALCCDSLN